MRDFLAHHRDARMRVDGLRHELRKVSAIHCQRVAGRHGATIGGPEQKRPRSAHLLFQQPRCGVGRLAF